MKSQKGYIINGAHVLCSKKPDKKTVRAIASMIELAKKMKVPYKNKEILF
jgi:hypothetical protein